MANDIFGKCQVCGADGGDAPASALTGADSVSSIVEAGSGVYLEQHKGKLMCRTCVLRLTADAESIDGAHRHAESQTFRDKVGFKREV